MRMSMSMRRALMLSRLLVVMVMVVAPDWCCCWALSPTISTTKQNAGVVRWPTGLGSLPSTWSGSHHQPATTRRRHYRFAEESVNGCRLVLHSACTDDDHEQTTNSADQHPQNGSQSASCKTEAASAATFITNTRLPVSKRTARGAVGPLFMTAAADVPAIGGAAVTSTTSSSTSISSANINGESSTAKSTTTMINTDSVPSFPTIVWRFSRPHTLIGSALAIPALHWLAAPSLRAALSWPCFASILYAMIPSLLMNLYITGINQVTDVEIDKINKPDLPMAAGILSAPRALAICATALVASLALGSGVVGASTPGLRLALWGSGLLGTLYSVPPFRLKRFPWLAAFCIVAVRGTIINAGFFAHAQQAAFGATSGGGVISCLLHNPRCFWSSLFFGVFGLVIAIMKDVPDVLGDKISAIRTLTVRVGTSTVFTAARRILTTLLAGTSLAMIQLAVMTNNNNPLLMGRRLATALCAAWAAVAVRQQARAVPPDDPVQVYNYYMDLWKIFYLSYLVLPLAR